MQERDDHSRDKDGIIGSGGRHLRFVVWRVGGHMVVDSR